MASLILKPLPVMRVSGAIKPPVRRALSINSLPYKAESSMLFSMVSLCAEARSLCNLFIHASPSFDSGGNGLTRFNSILFCRRVPYSVNWLITSQTDHNVRPKKRRGSLTDKSLTGLVIATVSEPLKIYSYYYQNLIPSRIGMLLSQIRFCVNRNFFIFSSRRIKNFVKVFITQASRTLSGNKGKEGIK